MKKPMKHYAVHVRPPESKQPYFISSRRPTPAERRADPMAGTLLVLKGKCIFTSLPNAERRAADHGGSAAVYVVRFDPVMRLAEKVWPHPSIVDGLAALIP